MIDPDDPNLSFPNAGAPEEGVPADDAPDAWAEADRAYAARWSDAGPRADPEWPAPAGPTPERPTPPSVGDAYLDGMQAAGPYLGLGVQIAASMAFFVGSGYALDRWLGTSPVWLLVGAVLGMVGIFALIVRIAREADAEKAARKKTTHR